MPRKAQSLKIKVKDEGIKGGRRRLFAEIVGDSKLFLSSDTFANRGTIPNLQEVLRVAISHEVNSYLKKGSEMIDLLDNVLKEKEGITKNEKVVG